jgi:hypothetical protein
MATPARAARNGADLVQLGVIAALLGGGYWFFRASRRSDVMQQDAEAARPTRHMVPLAARLDKEQLAAWLEAQDRAEVKGGAESGEAGGDAPAAPAVAPLR